MTFSLTGLELIFLETAEYIALQERQGVLHSSVVGHGSEYSRDQEERGELCARA